MSRETKDIFIENLIRIRKSKNITQFMLAEMADLSTGIIGELENGHRNPTLKTIEKIAKALNTPTYQFFIDVRDNSADIQGLSNEEKRKLIIELINSLQI